MRNNTECLASGASSIDSYLNLKFRVRFTGADLAATISKPLLINITFRFRYRYYPMKVDKTFRRFLAKLFVRTCVYVRVCRACIYTNTHYVNDAGGR